MDYLVELARTVGMRVERHGYRWQLVRSGIVIEQFGAPEAVEAFLKAWRAHVR